MMGVCHPMWFRSARNRAFEALGPASHLDAVGQEKSMRAIDVMVRDIVTALPETTVRDIANLMINHRVSGIPIVDADRQLLGIVTEGDLLRRVETGTARQHSSWAQWLSPGSRLAAEYVKAHARRVADI